MKLDANNNSRIIYRIAKSNLTSRRLYTFFSILTIILSVTFITAAVLFLQGTMTAERRMLENMQQVMFMMYLENRWRRLLQMKERSL